MRVAFGALTNYNSYKAFGLGLDREIAFYWQRALKDDHGAFNIPVKLSLPATETVTISWSFSGDAVAGTHFTEVVPSRSADIRNGQQEYLIPISLNGVGKWFKEKELIVTLSSTNAAIVEDQDQVRLIIHASTAPPEITVSTTLTGGFGATNLLDPETDWTVGSGDVNGWQAQTPAESTRALDTNPHGDTKVIWKAINLESANAYDGGYITPAVAGVDPTKTFRSSFWFKNHNNVAPGGGIRWQMTSNRPLVSGGSASLLFSEPVTNFTQGEWYLMTVLYHPYNYTGSDTGTSGIYDMAGNRIRAISEVKWISASDNNFREYQSHYGDPSDNSEEVWFWDPRCDLVDGTAPTITDLLNGDRGTSLPATFTASYAPEEDITVRYKVSGTAADGVGANSGDATIPAGSTTATLGLPYDGTHASGSTVVLSADYERNTVAFTELDWDPDTETFSSSRDVHVDENMWPFSNDVPAIGYDSETQRSAPKPWWPGYPSTLFPDGATLVAGHGDDGDYTVVDIVNQSTGIPRLEDPVTGNSLKYQVPNDNVQSGIPYIRNSFNAQWSGSRSLAHILKPWTRGSFRVVPMVGVDVGKNAKYMTVSQRVRSQNLNHYATFAWKNDSIGMNTSLTEGVSLNGSTVPVFTASDGTKIWIWQVSRPTPEIESLGLSGAWGVWYGAFEDDHGIGVYHIHNLNPNVEWEFTKNDGSVEIRYETPGVDKGNHIMYPTGIGEDLNDIRSNSKGNLSHSYRTEMSSTTLSGPPADFWPASGLFWTPWGNAVVNPSSTTSVTFTKA